MIKRKLLLLSSLVIFSANILATEIEPAKKADALTPYKASYKLLRKGTELGEGFRELVKTDGGYTIKMTSKIKWLFLSDSRKESSEFTIEDDILSAKKYSYLRTGTGPDREEITIFGAEKITSTYKNNEKIIIPIQLTYDSLLYQLAMRQDLIANRTPLNYHVVRRGKQTQYNFKIVGEETVTVPFGRIKTIRIERVRDNGASRSTIFWIAPSLNYTVVKMTQLKDGKQQAEMQLTWFKLD